MKILNIPSRQVHVFDWVPGYKFKLRFNNDAVQNSYKVECEEDVEYNLKFNKNGTMTYDMFVNFIHSTSIVDALKSISVQDFVLTFIVFNEYTMHGMDMDNMPRQGLYCVAVENPYKKFDPALMMKFCEEYNIPYLKPIYEGPTPSDPNFFYTLKTRSVVTTDNKAHGIYIIGDDGFQDLVKFGAEDFVQSIEDEPHKLLEEYVESKLTSSFVMNALKTFGVTLTNSTRVYNAIQSAMMIDPEFGYYKSQILKYESDAWLDKNIRPTIKKMFAPILRQMRQEK